MNREKIVSGAGFSWELNKFDLDMLLSLRTLWRPPVSTEPVCQYKEFHSAMLFSLDVKNVELDFRSNLRLIKDKWMS